MSADIFGDGLHGDVHAVMEGVEQHTGGPGVVEDDENIAGVSGGDDRGEILHFHGDRAGAFAPNQARVFLKEFRDACSRSDGS